MSDGEAWKEERDRRKGDAPLKVRGTALAVPNDGSFLLGHLADVAVAVSDPSVVLDLGVGSLLGSVGR